MLYTTYSTMYRKYSTMYRRMSNVYSTNRKYNIENICILVVENICIY